MNPKVIKRFIIYMAIATFVMFTFWAIVKSYLNRPAGDYETEVCDIRLKDKKFEQALENANIALEKSPNHRGAMMCKALVYISQKDYINANKELDSLINFLEKTLTEDDLTGKGTLAAAYANRGIIKDRNEKYEEALKDYLQSLGIDPKAVEGPGLGTVILNYKFKSSSVKERALYIYEQLKLPENERLLKIKELDEGQVMHKPSKL
ncbi:MAG: hypothetical protein CMI75_06815 [Candidatus Pelagibacter sp.]|nr:hypothetical protein [Candidatus Pelagibacter sp.]|tara:strand:+ start:121 stop:741 length:621 start_codon:yes stop_codon:yes gene_type:complete